MAEFRIEGMTALVKRLNSLTYTGSQARNVIQKNGAELQKDVQSRMTCKLYYVLFYSVHCDAKLLISYLTHNPPGCVDNL